MLQTKVFCTSSPKGLLALSKTRILYFYVTQYFLQRLVSQKTAHNLSGRQLAQNRDCFCDFGRKLVNLSLAVHVQCFAAMDGSKSLNAPWTGRLRRTRHSIKARLRQTQIFLFSYNGTKQTRLCAISQSYIAKRYRCKATPYFTSASIVSRLQGVCTDVFYLLLHIL